MAPKVTILTPTFNRRPYFPSLIKCVANQDYPLDRVEWIIGDDGTDKIGDLVKGIPYVKYIEYPKKLQLGEKRNAIMKEATGEIIIHFDDDDYYPPDRISHAVTKLEESGKLVGFVPYIHIYFKHIGELRRVGPFPKYCAPEASFVYRREILDSTEYTNKDSIGEGISFLKKCNDSFVELSPRSSILCFSHDHNSVPKSYFTDTNSDGSCKYQNVKESELELTDYVKDAELLADYLTNIDNQLRDYPYATVKEKHDISEIIDKSEEAQRKIDEMKKSDGVVLPIGNGKGLLLKKEAIAKIVIEGTACKQKAKSLKNQLEALTNQLFDIRYGRSSFGNSSPTKIAIIVAITQTAKGRTLWDVELLENLFKTAVKGLDPENEFTFLLCFDEQTEFGKDIDNHGILVNVIKAQAETLKLKIDVECIYSQEAEYHALWIAGFEKGRERGNKYFYFCDDQTKIETRGWAGDLVTKLQENGNVGLAHLDSGTPRTHCNFMINIKHYERLNHLFPKVLSNYAVEDWIKYTYLPKNVYCMDNHKWSRKVPDRRVDLVKGINDVKEKEERLAKEISALEKEAQHSGERSKPKALKPDV